MAGCRIGLLILAGFLLSGSFASAQLKMVTKDRLMAVNQPRLAPDSASFSFDVTYIKAAPMTEDDEPAVYEYRFRNVGGRDLNISRMVSTCSCMSVSVDRMRIRPGEDGVVSLRYDPKGHPGKFLRKVFIYTEGNGAPSAVLQMAAEVGDGHEMAVAYPVQKGRVRMVRDTVWFSPGDRTVESLPFINVSDRALTLRAERMMLPPCLEVTVSPSEVAPGEEGEIVVRYDSSRDRPLAGRQCLSVIFAGLGVPPSKSSVFVVIEK